MQGQNFITIFVCMCAYTYALGTPLAFQEEVLKTSSHMSPTVDDDYCWSSLKIEVFCISNKLF